MDIKELSLAMHIFVQSKGWYELDSPKPQTASNLAKSLMVESAEILEHFQWTDKVLDKESLADELADVALYLLQLAKVSEIDLEEAILIKLDKNKDRDWQK